MNHPFGLGGDHAIAGPIMYHAAVLVVGWVLGILSSPITDAIRRRSAKLRLTRAAVTELRSLQDTLAHVVVQTARRHRTLTRSLLEALLSTLKTSGQAAEGRASRAINNLLELDERALAESQAPASNEDARNAVSLRVQGLPFLESHLHRLDFYSYEVQRSIIEIRAGLQVFNQYTDEAMHYHFMMFGSNGSQQHMDVLVSNVETCYERAMEKASDLVSRLAALLQSQEMRMAWRPR